MAVTNAACAGTLAQLDVVERGGRVAGEDLAAVDGVVAEVAVGDVAVLVAEQAVALDLRGSNSTCTLASRAASTSDPVSPVREDALGLGREST